MPRGFGVLGSGADVQACRIFGQLRGMLLSPLKFCTFNQFQTVAEGQKVVQKLSQTASTNKIFPSWSFVFELHLLVV